MNEWNYDMEAAPKDGTRILAYIHDLRGNGNCTPDVIMYEDGLWWVASLSWSLRPGYHEPYAWMELSPAPLPEIPE